MASISAQHILIFMAVILFLVGLSTTIIGVVVLITRASGRELSALAAQTSRLAQKGLAESVAGLVGNATSLLDAINQLTKTTAGIGVFLTVIGLLVMLVSSWLVLQIR